MNKKLIEILKNTFVIVAFFVLGYRLLMSDVNAMGDFFFTVIIAFTAICICKIFTKSYAGTKVKKVILVISQINLLLVVGIVLQNQTNLFYLIPIRVLYYFVSVIIYPTAILLISRVIIKRNTSRNNKLAVCLVVTLSMLEYMLFYNLEANYIFNMALLNVLTVVANCVYYHKNVNDVKAKGILVSCGYILLWGSLTFNRVRDYDLGYKLTLNAAGDMWPVYYCGVIIFACIMYGFVGKQYSKYKFFNPIYLTAFGYLVIRLVTGINQDMVIECICIALLLASHIDNRKIRKYVDMVNCIEIRPVEECFKDKTTADYEVIDLRYDIEKDINFIDVFLFKEYDHEISNPEGEIRNVFYLKSILHNGRRYKLFLDKEGNQIIALEEYIDIVDGKRRKKYKSFENATILPILEEVAKTKLVKDKLEYICDNLPRFKTEYII